ncbi:MAG: hypothetical protein ACI9WU_004858 [Myxococcota bacterium]|jgi:hypothetical protein
MFKNAFSSLVLVALLPACVESGPVIHVLEEPSDSVLGVTSGLEEAEQLNAFDALIQKGITTSVDALTDDYNRPRFDFALFGASNPADRPRFDSDYFLADPVGTFRLQPGVTASVALNAFFAAPEGYGMECATAISVIHYAAVRYAFFAATGSDDLFDQRFTDMTIGRLYQGTENDIRMARKEVGTSNMGLGDHAYFHNPSVHPDAVAGGWNGENVIILGDDLYFGHPFGVTSSAEIIEKLNSVQDAAIAEPESAYLGGPVYRLEGAALWPTVKTYLTDKNLEFWNGEPDFGSNDEPLVDDQPVVDDQPPAVDDVCTNERPLGSDYSCLKQADWGKCGEPWMDGFCDQACGRCTLDTDVDDTPASCTDIAPDGGYTCQEQADWGKCGEPWMDGLCDATCGRCSQDVVPAVCTDVAPDGDYTCQEQADWGKCDEHWMADFCNATCDRCE